MKGTKNCPICEVEMPDWERYPNLVCDRCATRTSDAYGRRIKFFNTHFSGGTAAVYLDTNAEYNHLICYIDGIKCFAIEHRFGGIAVERIGK